MKNYWLIAGGIGLGLGLSELKRGKDLEMGSGAREHAASTAAFLLIGSSLVLFGGLKGFN